MASHARDTRAQIPLLGRLLPFPRTMRVQFLALAAVCLVASAAANDKFTVTKTPEVFTIDNFEFSSAFDAPWQEGTIVQVKMTGSTCRWRDKPCRSCVVDACGRPCAGLGHGTRAFAPRIFAAQCTFCPAILTSLAPLRSHEQEDH